jgi:transposase
MVAVPPLREEGGMIVTEERINLCLKAELVKPTDPGLKWQVIGARLHAMRKETAHALNETLSGLYVARGLDVDTSLQTLAYQMVGDVFKERGVETMGAMRSVVAQVAFQAFRRYLRETRAGITRSMPSFRSKTPVFFRQDQWSFNRRALPNGDGKPREAYVLGFRLTKDDPVMEFVLGVTGGNAHSEARKLLEAGTAYKTGDLKLKFDERKRKWFAILSYSKPKPDFVRGNLFAVHRGMHHMLYGLDESERGTPIFRGEDVRVLKLQMKKRARDLGRHRPELGTGAHGHGVRRRDAALIRLRDKEERFTETKMQQAAAAMVRAALSVGAGTIVVEDYSTIDDAAIDETTEIGWLAKRWPWYLQDQANRWAATKAGLEVLAVPSQFISRDCPNCGARCEDADNKRGTFTCPKCDYKRPIDYVNGLHMMRRAKRALAHASMAGSEGWTIVLSKKTGARTATEQYLPCTWATNQAATKALSDLLEPYPVDSPWREKLSVVKWPQSQKEAKDHPSEVQKSLNRKRKRTRKAEPTPEAS